MYFVSNKPGGFGGRDIYRCKKNPNGGWYASQNLGPTINTKYDEESPFVHPNGEDFFFSSQGHTSMGGFDIFVTIIDSAGIFDSVIALQYPINTTDDDEFYVSSPDNKRAYYASAHEDHSGFGEQDLYMISISQELEENEVLVLFKGQVVPDKGDTLPLGITVVVTIKGKSEPVGIYRPQRNGNFNCILKPKNTYIFSYQIDGKEFYREEIDVPGEFSFQEIERAIPLNPVKLKVETSLPNPVKKNISLKITVLDLKNFKPLGGARITLSDNSGNGYSLLADSLGKSQAIYLEPGKIYSIKAKYGEFGGDSVVVSTVGVKTEKKFSPTVYVSTLKETYNVDSLVAGKFIHYFEFNQTEFDHFHNYPLFLAEIDKAISVNGKLSIRIKASASKVPTKAKGGLPGLAKSRAEALKKKLIEYAVSKGVDPAKVTFQITTSVGGPAYKKDFLHHIREYEKFQYVEATLK
ncbi:MAG: PD40 domain-containing protein [Bacteroidia bacterium]|nr:PD40 domain-containing protein [Bacteroidia bacterium]